jgi:hypothetical protein
MSRPTTEPKPILEPLLDGPKGAKIPRCQFVRYGKHPKAGIQCKAPAIKDANCCRTHGGANSRSIGPLNSQWAGGKSKKGRWTALLSGTLQDSYVRALNDPEILSLDSELALIDVRMEELVDRANHRADWPGMRRAFDKLMDGMATGDQPKLREGLMAMREILSGHDKVEKNWEDVVSLAERRKNLAESERRRLVENGMYMSREQANIHARALVEVVLRRVKNQSLLREIMNDFRTVMDAGRAFSQLPESTT